MRDSLVSHQPEPITPQGVEPKPGEEPALSGQKPPDKILLIEDDLPMVRMYSTKLRQEKFEVETATDGEEGLRKARESLPDLIVLDLMIPKLGGMGVLAQLRAEARTKKIPVIILSNLSQEQDIQRAQELGVKEFLIKANFTPSQVVGKIKEHLGK